MLTSHQVRRHVDETMGEAVVKFIDDLNETSKRTDDARRHRIVAVIPVVENFVDVIVSTKVFTPRIDSQDED